MIGRWAPGAALLFSLWAGAGAVAAEESPARAAQLIGGRIYKTQLDAGGARIALLRYAAAGQRSGLPVLIVPELFCDRRWYDAFARALQQRGREVFLFEWRGSGESSRPASGFGDLAALLLGDAPAAFDAALEASGSDRLELIGHGLGGAAAVLLGASERGAHVSSLVLLSVPATYAIPNRAVENLLAAVRAQPGSPAFAQLAPYAAMPAPLGDPDRPGQWMEAQAPLDLFALLLAHGTALSQTRRDELVAGLGGGSPELFRDLARWMETGDLELFEGTRAHRARLSAAWAGLAQPALLVAAPLDDLVHPEHALALRGRSRAVRDELILQRIEGFPEDAGHLALQAPWGPSQLAPRILEWLDSHP